MENLLERMVKKMFPEGDTIDFAEFSNRAARRFRFKKEESKMLKKEFEKAKLISFWGPGNSHIVPSPSLNRTLSQGKLGIFSIMIRNKTSIEEDRR